MRNLGSTYSSTTTDPNPAYVQPTQSNGGGVVFSAFGGCRYRFNDHVGIYGELGYGISYLNIGVNFKF